MMRHELIDPVVRMRGKPLEDVLKVDAGPAKCPATDDGRLSIASLTFDSRGKLAKPVTCSPSPMAAFR
jgi:hypothetical protein